MNSVVSASDSVTNEHSMKGVPLLRRPASRYSKMHAYSGKDPRGMGSEGIDDWLHVSKDSEDMELGHAEIIGDFRHVSSTDFDPSESRDLSSLNGNSMTDILLDNVLDYVEYKNHEGLLTWVWGILDNGGRLQVSTRNLKYLWARRGLLSRLKAGANSEKWWADTMQYMYSSGAPTDWFLSCHTVRSLRSVLKKAGFVGVHVRSESDCRIVANAIKVESA